MTTRDFMEYPDEYTYSLEEAVHMQGRKPPFSPIAEVEEEVDISDGDRTTKRKKSSPRDPQQSPRHTRTSPKQSSLSPSSQHSSSSSDHSSSPRSPPSHSHPPPPSSQPPPLPTSRIPTGKTRASHLLQSASTVHHNFTDHANFRDDLPTRTHDKKQYYPADQHKSGYDWRAQQAAVKSHASDGHHPKGSRIPQPSIAVMKTKQQDGGTLLQLSDPQISSKLFPSFPDQSSLDTTLLSSEASTPVIDPGVRDSPSGASSPSTTPNSSLRQQDFLQTPDTKLAASTLSNLVAKSMEKESAKLHSHGGRETLVYSNQRHIGYPQPAGGSSLSSSRYSSPGRFMTRHQEKSTLASVSYNSPLSRKSVVALMVAQFNQNGNHSGSTIEDDIQGEPMRGSQVDDRRTSGGAKEKTPSPKHVKSPESTDRDETPSSKEGRRGGGRFPNPDTSPSSSMEELSTINIHEEDTDDAMPQERGVVKPEPTTIVAKSGLLAYPKPPPPPSSSHLHQHTHMETYTHPQHAHPYAYESLSQPVLSYGSPPAASGTHTRAYDSPATAKPYQLPYTQQHPYGYNRPEYRQMPHEFHVTGHHDYHTQPQRVQYGGGYSKLPRPEPHVAYSKTNMVRAHEAAVRGDVTTLHHMLTNHEIDIIAMDEHGSTLFHKAAQHGHLNILTLLAKEGGRSSITALQLPDENFATPPMLAVQGGHVECIQWIVEEWKVPLEVRDAGGETLIHHAAFHGQVKCLECLLKMVKNTDEKPKEILDNSGVTPAHFAAQGGHLDCLQLLLDYGYSVIHPDRENQKPLDWADAMGQIVCVRYLIVLETCWSLSAEVTHLAEQKHMLMKQNEQLREALSHQDQDHQLAMAKLQQQHEDRIVKMREQYVDLTASLLKDMKERDSPQSSASSSSGASTTTSKTKSQLPVRKTSDVGRRTKPPLPPDVAGKKRGQRSSEDGLDYRTATPQEILEKQMTTVAQRMNASREARKRQTTMATRAFSPLSPIIQRVYGKDVFQFPSVAKEDMKNAERVPRPRYEPHRSAPRVKFSSTVTEFSDRNRDTEATRQSSKTSGHSSSGHSPSHSALGHGGSPSHGTSGHSSDRSNPDGGDAGKYSSSNIRKSSEK